jgi:hypothetical protein
VLKSVTGAEAPEFFVANAALKRRSSTVVLAFVVLRTSENLGG